MHAGRHVASLAIVIAFLIDQAKSIEGLRIATFNIRQQRARDTKQQCDLWKEHTWTYRGPAIVEQIKQVNPQIIGLQEVSTYQLGYLKEQLGQLGYKAAAARKHASPIFYQSSVLTLDCLKRHWLSETPEIPSRGWDAKFNASVLVADFQYSDAAGTQKITVLNAHFDYVGATAREESSKLVVKLLQPYAQNGAGDTLTLITGDLNQDAESEPGYGIITGHRYEVAEGGSSDTFIDTRRAANASDVTTFTTFKAIPAQKVIDFIFVQDNGVIGSQWNVVGHEVVSNVGSEGFRISDHQLVTTCFGKP